MMVHEQRPRRWLNLSTAPTPVTATKLFSLLLLLLPLLLLPLLLSGPGGGVQACNVCSWYPGACGVDINLAGRGLTQLNASMFQPTASCNLYGDLILSNNPITTISANVFNGLFKTDITIADMALLTTIESNAFNNSVVAHLYIQQNPLLSTFQAGALDGLRVTGANTGVWIQNNAALLTLPSRLFSNVATPSKVFIENNAINALPGDVFDGCNMRQISLAYNQLTAIDGTIFVATGTNLGWFDLSGNPLTSVPASLFANHVVGSVYFTACNALTTLPLGLFASATPSGTGTLDFSNMDAMTVFPFGIFSGHLGTLAFTNIWIRDCLSLNSIAPSAFAGVTVTNFDVINCPQLSGVGISLAFDAITASQLTLQDLPGLTSLPPGSAFRNTVITAGGTLTVRNTAITTLPADAFQSTTMTMATMRIWWNAALVSITAGAFSSITNLEKMLISYNNALVLTGSPFTGLLMGPGPTIRFEIRANNNLPSIPATTFTGMSFANGGEMWIVDNAALRNIEPAVFVGMVLDQVVIENNAALDFGGTNAIPASFVSGLTMTNAATKQFKFAGAPLVTAVSTNAFQYLTVQELILENNGFVTLEDSAFVDLNVLSLFSLRNNAALEFVHETTFVGITISTSGTFDMSYCNISTLPKNMLSGFSNFIAYWRVDNNNGYECVPEGTSCALNESVITFAPITIRIDDCPAGETVRDQSTPCLCPTGFAGTFPSCNSCLPDYYNYPSCTYCLASVTCMGRGTCSVQGACQCFGGYTGVNCEIDINECSSVPCMNGGVCSDLIDSFSCNCTGTGFTGSTCEVDTIDDCSPSPCQNGGTCIDGSNTYSCACVTGFDGSICDSCRPDYYNYPSCTYCLASVTCMGRGTCSVQGACQCFGGYTGVNCEIDINECSSVPCMNGGVCSDLIDSFSCNCTGTGFTGSTCEVDTIDDCSPSPCQNGGTCMDGSNAYSCACAPGFTGTQCQSFINSNSVSRRLTAYACLMLLCIVFTMVLSVAFDW